MQELIAAKFDPPMWMGDQIRREALLGRLHGVLSHRLTLVHAPAGYGKTSLLSQWRDTLGPDAARVAWLTLERDDRDLKRSSNRPAVKRRRSPEMLRYVCRVQGRLRGRCMIAAEWVP